MLIKLVLWRFRQRCISGIYFKSDLGFKWVVVDRYRQVLLIAFESVETSLSECDWNIHFSPGLLKPNFLSLWIRFRAKFVGKGRQKITPKKPKISTSRRSGAIFYLSSAHILAIPIFRYLRLTSAKFGHLVFAIVWKIKKWKKRSKQDAEFSRS